MTTGKDKLIASLYEFVQTRQNDAASILINANRTLIYATHPETGANIVHLAACINNGVILSSCLKIYRKDVVNNKSQYDIIETKSDGKNTPLFIAIHNNAFDCIKLLVEAGADINAINHRQMNALHLAILLSYQEDLKSDYNKIVNYLWRECKKQPREKILATILNRYSESKTTLLAQAIAMRYWDIVKEILTEYPEAIAYESQSSLPILHTLVGQADQDGVKKVLEYNPALANDTMLPSGLNALHHAVMTCHKDNKNIFNILLDARVIIDAKADADVCATQFFTNSSGILKGYITPLGLAILTGNFTAVTSLIIWAKKNEIALLTTDDQSSMGTYLHLAITRLTLTQHSNPTQTRLSADKKDKLETIRSRAKKREMLVNGEKGIFDRTQIHEKEKQSFNTCDQFKILRWLLDYIRTTDVQTKEIIDTVNENGDTPLMFLLKESDDEYHILEIIKHLLKMTPKLDIINLDSQTAVDIARIKGFDNIVTLLSSPTIETTAITESKPVIVINKNTTDEVIREKKEKEPKRKENIGYVTPYLPVQNANSAKLKRKGKKSNKNGNKSTHNKPPQYKGKRKNEGMHNSNNDEKIKYSKSDYPVELCRESRLGNEIIDNKKGEKLKENKYGFFSEAVKKDNNDTIANAMYHVYNFYILSQNISDVDATTCDMYVKACFYHLLRFCRAVETFANDEKRLGNAIVHASILQHENDQLLALREMITGLNGILFEQILSRFEKVPENLEAFKVKTIDLDWSHLFGSSLSSTKLYLSLRSQLKEGNTQLTPEHYLERIESEKKSLATFIAFANKILSYDSKAEINFDYNQTNMAAARMSIIVIGECWSHICKSPVALNEVTNEQQNQYETCKRIRNKLAHEFAKTDQEIMSDAEVLQLGSSLDNGQQKFSLSVVKT